MMVAPCRYQLRAQIVLTADDVRIGPSRVISGPIAGSCLTMDSECRCGHLGEDTARTPGLQHADLLRRGLGIID